MLQQTFVIPALLIFLLSIPLITEIIPPNYCYGIRTPKTLSDSRIWYRANKFAGRVLMFASGFYLTVVVLTIHLPSINQNFGIWLLHFCSFMIPLSLGFLLIRRYINSL
jgi:uncharacterized membrane protein